MFNLGENELGNLLYQLIFLGILISSIFIRTTTDRGNKLKQLAIWLAIIFVGVIIYNNKYLLKNFVPYVASDTGENSLEIQKSSDKHFYITLKLNGKNVLFLIDTGATTTSLTLRDTKRLGIDVSKLKFNQMVNTANGITYNASVEIKNVQLNEYDIGSMWVLVSKDLDGNSLLGMNFLNKLKGYEVKRDKMILYY